MQKQNARVGIAALFCGLLLLLSRVEGQAGWMELSGTPHMGRWVLGSGGGPATARGLVLDGTLGEPLVGPARDDAISLGAGYWPSAAARVHTYLPLVWRSTQAAPANQPASLPATH